MNVMLCMSDEHHAQIKQRTGCVKVSDHLVALLELGLTEAQLAALKARAASEGVTLADFVRNALEIGTANVP